MERTTKWDEKLSSQHIGCFHGCRNGSKLEFRQQWITFYWENVWMGTCGLYKFYQFCVCNHCIKVIWRFYEYTIILTATIKKYFYSWSMDLFYRTFVTTPILCYVFGMHDCMLAIVGGLASITTYVVTVILHLIN